MKLYTELSTAMWDVFRDPEITYRPAPVTTTPTSDGYYLADKDGYVLTDSDGYILTING